MTILAIGYRSLFVVLLVALTIVCWTVIGGRDGALIWITSFLLLWGITRALDRLLGGFFLGSEASPRSAQGEREEV